MSVDTNAKVGEEELFRNIINVEVIARVSVVKANRNHKNVTTIKVIDLHRTVRNYSKLLRNLL